MALWAGGKRGCVWRTKVQVEQQLGLLPCTWGNRKVGVAFGSYGWSGEGVPILIDRMKSFGMSVIEPGTTAVQLPTKEDLERCTDLGKAVANGLLN